MSSERSERRSHLCPSNLTSPSCRIFVQKWSATRPCIPIFLFNIQTKYPLRLLTTRRSRSGRRGPSMGVVSQSAVNTETCHHFPQIHQ